MRLVLSLGGSVLVEDFPECRRVEDFARVLKRLSEKHRLFVVTGGGKVAREYISALRKFNADNTFCDMAGIEVTRLNARILIAALLAEGCDVSKEVPENFERALELSNSYRIVVMGGTFPGHTTDATSALLAEFVKADMLLNATNVDGVYEEDPRVNPDAKKYSRIKASDLVRIVAGGEAKAGSSNVIDLLAAKVIERSGIRAIVFLATPENVEKAVSGEIGEAGTVVEP